MGDVGIKIQPFHMQLSILFQLKLFHPEFSFCVYFFYIKRKDRPYDGSDKYDIKYYCQGAQVKWRSNFDKEVFVVTRPGFVLLTGTNPKLIIPIGNAPKIEVFLITEKDPVIIQSLQFITKLYHIIQGIIHDGKLHPETIFIMFQAYLFSEVGIFFGLGMCLAGIKYHEATDPDG
ncbi:hypothetical protein D3C86_821720 [compost metagenome]